MLKFNIYFFSLYGSSSFVTAPIHNKQLCDVITTERFNAMVPETKNIIVFLWSTM